MFILKASLFLVPVLLLGRPWSAAAHVKWFVREDSEGSLAFPAYSLAEPAVQFWVVTILVCTAVAMLLDRYLPLPPKQLINFARDRRPQIIHLFQILVGVALLITAVKGAILAPHLQEPSVFGIFLRLVAGAIGILFIANRGIRAGAGCLVLLFVAHAGLFGFVSSLEYFNFLGIALFLFIESTVASRFQPYAVPILRVHTGIALGVLAWTEKLINLDLAMRFLEDNPINFMRSLGMDFFSDRLFVLCAGCTELIFAIIFTLGLITRINTVAIAGFLISSNVYFLVIGKTDEALLELIGHLPLVAIAIILIIYGSGTKLRLSNLFFRKENRGSL
jgi:hypothetical protein